MSPRSAVFLGVTVISATLAVAAPARADVVDVTTAAQLRAALAGAVPGQTIRLAPGTYRGSFVTTKPGPVTLSGPADAVLINDGPAGDAPACPAPTAGWDSGYGLWIFNSPHWNLTGFTVQESKKGIVLDNAHHTTIDSVSVHHVDEEDGEMFEDAKKAHREGRIDLDQLGKQLEARRKQLFENIASTGDEGETAEAEANEVESVQPVG